SGESVGYAYICPGRSVKERLNSGQAVVAEFEDEDAAGLEMCGGLCDEIGVQFVAFFAAVESNFRFVVAHYAHERRGFAAPDVGGIAHDEIEETRFVFRDL